jgi:hypothetical protein
MLVAGVARPVGVRASKNPSEIKAGGRSWSGNTPASTRPRPKTHPLLPLIAVTLPNTTSSIPVGDLQIIPARFRIFPNYDLQNPGTGGKEIQPGLQRAPLYQNSHRGFQDGDSCPLRREAWQILDPGARLNFEHARGGARPAGPGGLPGGSGRHDPDQIFTCDFTCDHDRDENNSCRPGSIRIRIPYHRIYGTQDIFRGAVICCVFGRRISGGDGVREG